VRLTAIQGAGSLVFPFEYSDTIFHSRFNQLLWLAGLPGGRKNQTQRIRRSHLTYWAVGGGDPTARAQHSSAGVTSKHYLDATLMPHENPEDRLPRLRLG
jgi:hypothetical protein